VLALTVDLPVSNRELLARHRRATNAECQACHAPGANLIPPKPIYDGIDLTGGEDRGGLFMDWDFVDRLKRSTSMRLVLKGIVTREDARLAVEHGVDGIIVSNHGGRAEDSGRSTIESLSEVVDAVDGRIPVIVDGGFRRGTDIFKALALGADAIAIGRPYLWGLGSFGQEGVETVLDLLKRELEIVMRQARTTSIEEINRSYIA
jgi:isopentenyl diphosphate isomerase/L-lactate dehydrogenase-like FMN-dependent dehydrogenase